MTSPNAYFSIEILSDGEIVRTDAKTCGCVTSPRGAFVESRKGRYRNPRRDAPVGARYVSFTRTAFSASRKLGGRRGRCRCQREISAGRVSPRSPPRRARVRRAVLSSPRRAFGPVVRAAMRGARDRRARSRRPPRRALCGTNEGSRDVLSNRKSVPFLVNAKRGTPRTICTGI